MTAPSYRQRTAVRASVGAIAIVVVAIVAVTARREPGAASGAPRSTLPSATELPTVRSIGKEAEQPPSDSPLRLAPPSEANTRLLGTVFDVSGEPTHARIEIAAEGAGRVEPIRVESDRATGTYAAHVDADATSVVVRAHGPGRSMGERRVALVEARGSGVVRADVYLVATSGETVCGSIVDAETGFAIPAEILQQLLRSSGKAAVFSGTSGVAGGVWAFGRLRGAFDAIPAVVDVRHSEFVVTLPKDWEGDLVLLSHGGELARTRWSRAAGGEAILRVSPESARLHDLVVRAYCTNPDVQDVRASVARESPQFVDVESYADERSAVRSGKGTFEVTFPDLPTGTYVIRVAAFGCAEETQEVTAEDLGGEPIVFALASSFGVNVCFDSEPSRPSAEHLRVYSDSGQRLNVEVRELDERDGGGGYRVDGLGDGTVHLVIRGSRLVLDLPGMADATVRWLLAPKQVVRFSVGPYDSLPPGSNATCEVTPFFTGTRIPAVPRMTYSGRVSRGSTIDGTLLLPSGSYDLRVRIGARVRTVPCEVLKEGESHLSVVVR